MKKIFITAALLSAFAVSCTKLDVNVESQLTPSNFPTSPASFLAATGPVYTQLRSIYAVDYWRMQELSTDEAIIPARDGNYDDGGQYRFLHLHTWNPDHPNVKSNWEWGFGGINTCNRIIKLFEEAPESDSKKTSIAEMRAMRALFYYFMMDLYGNVPIISSFPVNAPPQTAQRPQVFAFIEKELKEAIPNLSTVAGQTTYGRPTKWMAFALLEKLYLNAQYYTGQPRYTETVAMADSVLDRAKSTYSLDADYMSIFAPENGPQTKETIFAVPYDPNVAEGNHFTRYGLHTAVQNKYSIPFRPSIAMSTIKEFYEKFNITGDLRNNTWLAGKQYENDGSPIIIKTTKKGLDASYAGADGTAAVNYQLDFTPDMQLVKPATMDVGNDELGKAKGVRSIKFYPDKNSNPSTRYQGNDMPVLRLADVMMMKAEAILRGATPTTVGGELQTADVLVNKIRTRSKAPVVSGITLDELLNERAREFAWEGWRRNDLIRFGKFENAWGFKTNTDVNKRIYPVPTSEKALNPNLVQNPGY
ncbi:RagB/SusD family nutrient uptake outer membrane protein [Mucilaginibacter sp. Bleaf8]|uniref:RagB/SusD family nutrient uptake outer membrane protein n=1 Tax=Mucilaginibacter sp. Bleaf8 TaxID=2834430 RepID=UPI001BCC3709|nr:RagB/SusD family nutrient uptake outer membrane protein [Mucilaginibacter sp. Bleaf8]MBS7562930.1 RagB/SusD family nutrient uptake outer membrane protein [Mucilaginibacter sp. Bleaf8]